ncbi:MAG: hypothetical protein ACLTC4_06555 [Hungatella hathewayi]|nr:hypothetical protein [Hungatella hathewayi]
MEILESPGNAGAYQEFPILSEKPDGRQMSAITGGRNNVSTL